MVPALRLILQTLDAQSLLYLGQVTVGLRMVWEAAHSFCVLHLSFATGLFGQVTVGLRMVWKAVHSFCLLHLSFATGLFGQVMVGLRIVCEATRSFLLHPAAFLCHWPFWTGQDSG